MPFNMKNRGVDLFDSSSSLDLINDHHESQPRSRLSSFSCIESPTKESSLWLNSNGEFKQHYDSIMYSTNLVDSCVEALNDIAVDDGSSLVLRGRENNLFNQFRLTAAGDRRGNLTGSQQAILDDDRVMAFEQWLTAMEERVANYPTLSQIYAMEAQEMRYQFELHSKTFNDIVAQPCVVKNSVQEDHRALAERYHLLYLRAYEVLLLLEGLPFSKQRGSYLSMEEDDDKIDGVTRLETVNDENDQWLDDVDVLHRNLEAAPANRCKKNRSRVGHRRNGLRKGVKARRPTIEYNQRSTDDSCIGDDAESSGSGDSHGRDEKPTSLFDTDILSLFDNMDELYETLKYEQRECGMETSPDVLRAAPTIDNNSGAYDYQRYGGHVNDITTHSYFGQDVSVYEQHTTITTTTNTTDIVYNKVYNWLNSHTITEHTFEQSDVRSNFVYITKAKSETNMDAAAPINRHSKRLATSTASLNCLSSGKRTLGSDLEDETGASDTADDAMQWDYFLPDLLIDQQQFHLDDWNEYCMSAIEWNLCFFGENYEYHLDFSDSISANSLDDRASLDSDDDISMDHQFESTKAAIDEIDAMASTATLHTDSEKVLKRRRRRNNRRVKKMRNQRTSVPIVTDDASVKSYVDSEPSVATSATDNYTLDPESMTSLHSTPSRTSTPSTESAKSIRYNSDDQSFEVFAGDTADTAPIKHKVNELKPEDFHDIIKMCRSNIDCVITVLGAEPNRVLTVNYCQKMRWQRASAKQNASDELCRCNEHKLMMKANAINATNVDDARSAKTSVPGCKLEKGEGNIGACCHCTEYTCLCSWIAQTIAMIINFLLDCWNIFRNMRLYSYLGAVLRGFFAATREVAKRINSQRELTKALTYKTAAC